MTWSNAQAKSKKYILLNSMESKCSLLMKIDQFMSYYKRKNFVKKVYKIPQVPGPFVFTKNLAQPLLENEIFEASYLY